MRFKGSTLIEALVATIVIMSTMILVITCVLNVMKTFGHLQTLKAEITLETLSRMTEVDRQKTIDRAQKQGIHITSTSLQFKTSDKLIEVNYVAKSEKGKVLSTYRKVILKDGNP